MELTELKKKINNGHFSKIEVAEKLGISRPTLDKRLFLGNWKKGEIKIIMGL